ncbi:hypothetical protein EDB92DRAFT_1843271, partial [Lactarius akahatsu]
SASAPLSRIVDFLASCQDRGLISSQSLFRFDCPWRNQIPGCLNDLDTRWYLHGHEVSGHVVLSLHHLPRYLWGHGALPITYASVLGPHRFLRPRKQFLCRSLSQGRANCCALFFIPPHVHAGIRVSRAPPGPLASFIPGLDRTSHGGKTSAGNDSELNEMGTKVAPLLLLRVQKWFSDF